MVFEWHPLKASRNHHKHGVDFGEATSVFMDPLALTYDDPAHSIAEKREITIGVTLRGRCIFVSHCERAGRIRIISARMATRRERQQYEEHAKF